ncbi:hypothetical protein QVD99_000811 [Batrachochytrium dendrobatidis]|nr:hypothetical protein O5D80_003661 [Batrachochytrium dendrobatidis]KAK5673362.1 hypothetical protein QVD99_000811 [Batrachochytrium dendrobatidis]
MSNSKKTPVIPLNKPDLCITGQVPSNHSAPILNVQTQDFISSHTGSEHGISGSHDCVASLDALPRNSPLVGLIRSRSESGVSSTRKWPHPHGPRLLGKEYVRGSGSFLRRTSSFGGGPPVVRTRRPVPVASLPLIANVASAHDTGYLRWIILFLSCFLLFGNFYAYDNPAALNRLLQQFLGHDYDTWQYELNLLYSVYSFPNMFLPFIGGQLADRFDPRVVLLVFSTTVCVGQTLFSIGVSTKCFALMVFGRVLFGIGGESISVIQSTITTSYFKNKELAIALGLNLCISRLGSVVNSILSPRIALATDASVAVWIGSGTCYVSLLCAIILSTMISGHPTLANIPTNSLDETLCTLDERAPLLACVSTQEEPAIENTVDRYHADCHLASSDATLSGQLPFQPEPTKSFMQFNLKGLNQLPLSFWILCIICILLYGTVIPFNNIASDFFMSKWYPNDPEKAGIVMSIPDSMSAILVPILGYFVDRYGGRVMMLMSCAVVIVGVHLTLGLSMINPIYPMVFLGCSYSLYGVAIWPSVATVIQHEECKLKDQNPDAEPPRLLGAAFGLSTSALNAALTLVPLIAAQIRVQGGSYLPVEIFFASLAAIGVIFCLVLYVVDSKNDRVLQLPEMMASSTSFDSEIVYNTVSRCDSDCSQNLTEEDAPFSGFSYQECSSSQASLDSAGHSYNATRSVLNKSACAIDSICVYPSDKHILLDVESQSQDKSSTVESVQLPPHCSFTSLGVSLSPTPAVSIQPLLDTRSSEIITEKSPSISVCQSDTTSTSEYRESSSWAIAHTNRILAPKPLLDALSVSNDELLLDISLHQKTNLSHTQDSYKPYSTELQVHSHAATTEAMAPSRVETCSVSSIYQFPWDSQQFLMSASHTSISEIDAHQSPRQASVLLPTNQTATFLAPLPRSLSQLATIIPSDSSQSFIGAFFMNSNLAVPLHRKDLTNDEFVSLSGTNLRASTTSIGSMFPVPSPFAVRHQPFQAPSNTAISDIGLVQGFKSSSLARVDGDGSDEHTGSDDASEQSDLSIE